jgi:peptidoglycan/xylan/chitin deacetylase (PgdA/CDA1 family)
MTLHGMRRYCGTMSVAVAVLVLCACASQPRPPASAPVPPAGFAGQPYVASAARPARTDRIVARNDHFLIYAPESGESLATIARRFLGAEDRAWVIAEFNNISEAKTGQPLVVPLQASNPTGVFANGYQTVPILCYHRFGSDEGKMVLSPKVFAQQMEYLQRNGYRVLRLSELTAFLTGKRQLPARAVVITIDDGYGSMYAQAYPILKRYGFPATVFVYTDFIGARDALTWEQMREMVGSGLIDIEAHSKSHSNLTLRLPGETDSRYRDRLAAEASTPREVLQRKLHVKVSSYAYPYGDANAMIMDQLNRNDYKTALTVDPGGNAFFTPPLLLRRTMVLGDEDLEAFKAQLQVFNATDLR